MRLVLHSFVILLVFSQHQLYNRRGNTTQPATSDKPLKASTFRELENRSKMAKAAAMSLNLVLALSLLLLVSSTDGRLFTSEFTLCFFFPTLNNDLVGYSDTSQINKGIYISVYKL